MEARPLCAGRKETQNVRPNQDDLSLSLWFHLGQPRCQRFPRHWAWPGGSLVGRLSTADPRDPLPSHPQHGAPNKDPDESGDLHRPTGASTKHRRLLPYREDQPSPRSCRAGRSQPPPCRRNFPHESRRALAQSSGLANHLRTTELCDHGVRGWNQRIQDQSPPAQTSRRCRW